LRPVFIALLATPLVSAPLRLPAQSPRDAASRGIQAANDRSIVAYSAGDDSTYMHMSMFIMDTVVPGGEYDIRRLLEQMPPVDQVAAEYRAILRIACVGEGGRAAVLDDAAAVAADYADNEPTGR